MTSSLPGTFERRSKKKKRFNVKYVEDDATQANVCYERIRLIPKPTKKRGRKRKADSSPDVEMDDAGVDVDVDVEGADEPGSPPIGGVLEAASTPSTSKTLSSQTPQSLGVKVKTDYGEAGYIPDPVELEMASKMGLPEGWTCKVRPGSRFIFLNPEGTLKFTSKRAVCAHLGLPPPKHGYNPLKDDDDDGDGNNKKNNDKKKKNSKKKKKVDDDDVFEITEQDPEDDPPWRTDGNDYLGKRVKHTFLDGVTAMGTITGWISDKDVDREGNPGFVSEKTNEPACLFHVTMDSTCAVASQDFEEYELEYILMESDNDGEEGDDE